MGANTQHAPPQGLPGIMAAAIGRDIEDIYRSSNKGVLADVDLLQRITQACRDCVGEFVRGECAKCERGWGRRQASRP